MTTAWPRPPSTRSEVPGSTGGGGSGSEGTPVRAAERVPGPRGAGHGWLLWLELISSCYVRVRRAKAVAQKTDDGKCGLSQTVLNCFVVSLPQESGKGRLLKSCLQKVSKENLLAAIKACIT